MIFVLIILLLPILIPIFSHAKSIVSVGIVMLALSLPLVVSGFFLAIRRLHDLNLSGWYWLLLAVLSQIGIGLFIQFFLMCKKGTKGPNRFGNDPIQNDSVLES